MLVVSLCVCVDGSGSLLERAERLLSVRGKAWDEIPTKIKDPKAKAAGRTAN